MYWTEGSPTYMVIHFILECWLEQQRWILATVKFYLRVPTCMTSVLTYGHEIRLHLVELICLSMSDKCQGLLSSATPGVYVLKNCTLVPVGDTFLLLVELIFFRVTATSHVFTLLQGSKTEFNITCIYVASRVQNWVGHRMYLCCFKNPLSKGLCQMWTLMRTLIESSISSSVTVLFLWYTTPCVKNSKAIEFTSSK